MYLVVSLATGWGFGWVVGLSVVYFIQPAYGWVLMGGIVGLTTALAMRRVAATMSKGSQLAILIGWSIGGAAAASTIDYNVLAGWSVMATIGASVTAVAAIGAGNQIKPIQIITISFGCVLGGVGAAAIMSRAGIILGPLIGRFISGRTLPFILSAAASGVGGIIAGFIGGSSLLCQMRHQS